MYVSTCREIAHCAITTTTTIRYKCNWVFSFLPPSLGRPNSSSCLFPHTGHKKRGTPVSQSNTPSIHWWQQIWEIYWCQLCPNQ